MGDLIHRFLWCDDAKQNGKALYYHNSYMKYYTIHCMSLLSWNSDVANYTVLSIEFIYEDNEYKDTLHMHQNKQHSHSPHCNCKSCFNNFFCVRYIHPHCYTNTKLHFHCSGNLVSDSMHYEQSRWQSQLSSYQGHEKVYTSHFAVLYLWGTQLCLGGWNGAEVNVFATYPLKVPTLVLLGSAPWSPCTFMQLLFWWEILSSGPLYK